MTPGARVQAAIELLDGILSGTPAEKAITGWARRSRFAGSKDRAAVRDHVFQALRGLKSYAARGGADTGRGIMIGALRSDAADLSEIFTGAGHAPSPLTPEEIATGREPETLEENFDLPEWIIPQFINSMGGEAQAIEGAGILRYRAPVTLRVNLRKSTVADAMSMLARDDISSRVVPGVATALIVLEGARRVAGSAAYRDGLVELQDASSQAAMALLGIPPGARCLDYCAGGGGKVLALAAGQDGAWFAHDALPNRMKDLPARAARAGAKVTLLTSDQAHADRFDTILCDVPCSGSGTWRRAPDAKWRFSINDLNSLMKTQDDILDQAARMVGQGGTVSYTTCSVLSCENEERITEFHSRNPGWSTRRSRRWPISEDGDGFFFAQLERV